MGLQFHTLPIRYRMGYYNQRIKHIILIIIKKIIIKCILGNIYLKNYSAGAKFCAAATNVSCNSFENET